MSRLVVKNLANSVTEDKIRKAFSAKGVVTDVQLKYTKDGKFRHFGFVGFKTKEEAEAAREFLNNTYLKATKIQVEFCADLGDPNKPKAWSKYSQDSTAYKKINEPAEETIVEPKKEKKKEKKEKVKDPTKELLKKHKDDPLFAEFLESHGKSASILADVESEDSQSESEDAEESEKEDDDDDEEEEKEEEEKNVKTANKNISDLEYLKSKMEDAVPEKTEKILKPKTPREIKTAVRDTLFTLKLRGLTYKSKKKDIKQFFHPIKPKSIRLCPKVKGIAYAGFVTEKDMKKALNKNKSILAGRQIWVMLHSKPKVQIEEGVAANGNKWTEQEDSLKNEESIAESGRIFVRNLAYTVTEEEVEQLFSKYGPVTEVTVPIDRMSRKVKGFALVTFMVPENAAKAYTELDGSVFQGRMMHLLPGKAKKSLEEMAEAEGLTFKQRQLLQQKAQSGSSHNWNSLFLGANAVADIMARTYNTTKEKVLDPESRDSVAVRLALGETQLVSGTRDFLEQNGICLDAFNQAPKQRSKYIILAKNLPAGTTADELREMFAKHGVLGRLVLPPSGVTAIIEFMDPGEARTAFTRLAYSKFKHLPLYLEWAPENTFLAQTNKSKKKKKEKTSENTEKVGTNSVLEKSQEAEESEEGSEEESEEEVEEEVEAEPDTTLFVKNLNFSTTDEILKQHFIKCGKIVQVSVAKKKDARNPGQMLSMGYGFVQFQKRQSADTALKNLQQSMLQEHAIELKRSNRTLQGDVQTTRKKAEIGKQTGTKIIVRNIPFQATQNEVTELFKVFGELKAVRLPRKMVGTGPHRGFAFVDYYTKGDAKRAFKALCQSTHLYGRRLVLEWAAPDESVEELRKRTAQHFHQEDAPTSKKSVLQLEKKEAS